MSSPTRRYYRGHDLVAMRDVQAGQNRYYHFDHQGTTQCLTDSTGAVTDRFASDAWGLPVKRTGSSINRQWFVGNSGYSRNLSAELYVRARFYSCFSATWMSRDPLSRSFQPYSYAADSPARFIDPSGLIVKGPEITDRFGFGSGNQHYVYTCKCGWLDATHMLPFGKDVQKLVNRFFQYRSQYFNTAGGRFAALIDVPGWSIVPFSGSGDYLMGPQIPPPFDLAWQRIAKWVIYDLSWQWEQSQAFLDSIHHSHFSYEDLMSNYIGVLSAFDKTGNLVPNIRDLVRNYYLKECGAVSRPQAAMLYECMELACKRGLPCHRTMKVKTPSATNPINDIILFHELYPWCFDCDKICQTPPPGPEMPINLYNSEGLDRYVKVDGRFAWPDNRPKANILFRIAPDVVYQY